MFLLFFIKRKWKKSSRKVNLSFHYFFTSTFVNIWSQETCCSVSMSNLCFFLPVLDSFQCDGKHDFPPSHLFYITCKHSCCLQLLLLSIAHCMYVTLKPYRFFRWLKKNSLCCSVALTQSLKHSLHWICSCLASLSLNLKYFQTTRSSFSLFALEFLFLFCFDWMWGSACFDLWQVTIDLIWLVCMLMTNV